MMDPDNNNYNEIHHNVPIIFNCFNYLLYLIYILHRRRRKRIGRYSFGMTAKNVEEEAETVENEYVTSGF